MSANGRRVSITVNESALKAWLTGGKPANLPTPPPPPATSRAPESRPSESKAEKRG